MFRYSGVPLYPDFPSVDICQCITAILPGVVKHETQIRSDCNQGRSQDVSKGGGGSHCVKHYRRDVFATEYYRLFS